MKTKKGNERMKGFSENRRNGIQECAEKSVCTHTKDEKMQRQKG